MVKPRKLKTEKVEKRPKMESQQVTFLGMSQEVGF